MEGEERWRARRRKGGEEERGDELERCRNKGIGGGSRRRMIGGRLKGGRMKGGRMKEGRMKGGKMKGGKMKGGKMKRG